MTAADYLALKLQAPEVEVADSEVEARLEEIRQANALVKPPAEARGVKEADLVVLDYQGYLCRGSGGRRQSGRHLHGGGERQV